MVKRIPLQFLGANGFPCPAYAPILKLLAAPGSDPLSRSTGELCFDSRASDVFPAMEGQRDWRNMVHALVQDIENRNEPVIGLGHSFGGALMLCAAAARPKLFRQLIIIGMKHTYARFTFRGP